MTVPSPGYDLLCLGELLIDMVPADAGASLERAATFVRAAGGAPANVAVAAARLGAGVGVVATVGHDAFGRYLLTTLDEAGVDTTSVHRVPRQTAVAFVGLSDGGERDFEFYGDEPAHDHITEEQAVTAVGRLTGAGTTPVFHFGSVCLAREPARSATEAAIAAAQRAGCLVSCDVNLRESFWQDLDAARDVIWRYVERADIVKLSAEEATFLGRGAQRTASDVVDRLLVGTASLVVVSGGARGATAYTRGFHVSAAAPPVRAVDTTGAGDALTGALLAATVQRPGVWDDAQGAETALRRAVTYASLSTTRRGAIPSYPEAAELESFDL